MTFSASGATLVFCGTGQAGCGLNGGAPGLESFTAGNATSGQDLNWNISFTNDGVHSTPGKSYVAQPCGSFGDCNGAPTNFPFGAWATSATNEWISAFTGDTNSLPANGGEYDFTETLNLTGITSGAELKGTWAADNCLMGIFVNGTLVAGPGTCSGGNNFASKTAFDITSGFVYGAVNTITFKIYNETFTAPNPGGLLVEVSSATGVPTGTSTPEPATMVGVGLGLALLGLRRFRRV